VTAPAAAPRSPSRRCAWILVALVLLAAVAEFLHRDPGGPPERAGWLLGDGAFYRNVTRAILTEGTLDYARVNPRDAGRYDPGMPDVPTPLDTNASLARDGRLVPARPVLLPLALLLPYALLREPGLLVFNVLQGAALVLLVFGLARRYAGDLAAMLAAAGFLADSDLRGYLYNVSPDVFGAVLVMGGTVAAWSGRMGLAGPALGGLLLGLSLWLRPVNAVGLLALGPLLLQGIRTRRPAPVLAAVAGVLLGVSGFLALNAAWFGSPLVTPYDRLLLVRNGARETVSLRDYATRPLFESLYPTFVGHRQSFLASAPHWPLFLAALPALVRAWPAEVAALNLMVFLPVLFLAKYDFWNVSHSGNRFMLLSAAISAVSIGWLVERLRPAPDAGPAPPGAG
jgi:hypothetical protein